jgi:SNW domain-containing protein 1
VSEKIALGQAQPTMTKDMLFDSRLFSQASGLAVALGDEEAYNVYDRPFALGGAGAAGGAAASIYRPRRDAMAEPDETDPAAADKITKTDRFVADRGFQGADKAEKRDGMKRWCLTQSSG